MSHLSTRTKTARGLRVAAAAAALLLVLAAMPVAQASTPLPPMGMSIKDIGPLKSAGAAPRYGSYWAGEWMASSGWGGFDSAMKSAKAAGVTPVVYWYYWGDSISPSCVEHGCNSRNRAEWTALTKQLADHIRATMGGAEVLIVLENEFNKGGITGTYAPKFDTHLEAVAKTLRGVSGVKLILGFGNWGEEHWGKFPKSIAQSHYIGFQMMRASTKDTEASYRGAADRSAHLTNFIATKFNKPSFLYDVALSSYPDARWARIQAETLDAIFAKLSSSGSTGLKGIVYRSLNDHYMSPANYYGYAESHWGLRTKYGTPKPAFDVWLKHAKGTATSTTSGSTSSGSTSGFTATFSGVKGNAYWVQTSVSGTQTISSVCASVDGGSCRSLAKQSYGWASSFYVPEDAKVVFRATSSSGATAHSGTYQWPEATLVSSSGSTSTSSTSSTSTSSGSATFSPYGGNEWWVQTKVSSSKSVRSVCASVNGGSCQPLALKSWGAWADSIRAPTGSRVVFKATLGDGSVATSSTYTWPVK